MCFIGILIIVTRFLKYIQQIYFPGENCRHVVIVIPGQQNSSRAQIQANTAFIVWFSVFLPFFHFLISPLEQGPWCWARVWPILNYCSPIALEWPHRFSWIKRVHYWGAGLHTIQWVKKHSQHRPMFHSLKTVRRAKLNVLENYLSIAIFSFSWE